MPLGPTGVYHATVAPKSEIALAAAKENAGAMMDGVLFLTVAVIEVVMRMVMYFWAMSTLTSMSML